MNSVKFENNIFYIEDSLDKGNAEILLQKVVSILKSFGDKQLILNLKKLNSIDSAGVAALDQIIEDAQRKSISIQIQDATERIQESIRIFSSRDLAEMKLTTRKINVVENVGKTGFNFLDDCKQFIILVADMFYWGIGGLFSRQGQRKGEFINQTNLIGVNALPIIGLISFLIGFILSLQSAQQLREFGANIFVVDLISISMTREMAPLMTAIILAGRSGSSIASEIATMKISEEIDALKTMALNPIKYIVLPKLYAMTLSTPLLTVFADIIGIAGGFMVGILFLKIGPLAFIDRMASVMVLKDVITFLVKSLVFAWIITVVGVFFGLRTKGGADAVGRSTTSSVVVAIFMVIVADSVLGLLFY